MKALRASSLVVAFALLLLSVVPIATGALAVIQNGLLAGLLIGALPGAVLWGLALNVTARTRVEIEILERLRRLDGRNQGENES